jgi:hypothetical protein
VSVERRATIARVGATEASAVGCPDFLLAISLPAAPGRMGLLCFEDPVPEVHLQVVMYLSAYHTRPPVCRSRTLTKRARSAS